MVNFFSRLGDVVRWYPTGATREEKKLIFKIDLLVLVYACLAFFTKYLDVTALTNAYVSGMKEDLNLYGNRLNYVNAAYETGYVVFQIPSNILITRFPSQYYLPAMEVLWGLFTLGTAFVQDYKQLVVMRFFVGLCATSCYVGLVHIINSWYRRQEMGRRNALFWISNPIGTMFAGYLQSAAYTNLSGHGGLEGWRWLFIICTIITIPVAIIGFVFFPDVPERTQSRFFTEAEKELARSRLEKEGFRPSTGLSWAVASRVLSSWRFYWFVGLLLLFCNCIYPIGTPFILWLKSQPDKYSIPLVNNIGTITSAVAVVSALFNSYYTDLRGKRWEPVVFGAALSIFATLVLTIWNIPNGLKFFAFIALGWAEGLIPVIVAWTAEGLAGDLEVRAITLASYNCLGEATSLVVPLVAWPVSKAPRFLGGYIWVLIISVLWLVVTVIIIVFERRETLRKVQPPLLESESSVEEASDHEKGTKSPTVLETTVTVAKVS